MLLKNDTLYCASVGDSRAVLATSTIPVVLPAPTAHIKDDFKILNQIRKRRSCKTSKKLQSVQLTRDQKPEDPEEAERIIKSGGRVQRLVDEQGKYVGPFRV